MKQHFSFGSGKFHGLTGASPFAAPANPIRARHDLLLSRSGAWRGGPRVQNKGE
jgi:hypothetical protein